MRVVAAVAYVFYYVRAVAAVACVFVAAVPCVMLYLRAVAMVACLLAAAVAYVCWDFLRANVVLEG